MNGDPAVSVIVAFHNAVDYLEEAVRSVQAQSHEDWELLLIDDGSTDGSTELARSFAADPRIRCLRHPGGANRGTSASRNLGIEGARGRYIAQLDADDVLLPGHLEHLVGVLEAEPDAVMAYGAVERWYGWSDREQDVARDFTARPLPEYDTLLRPPELIAIMLRVKYGVPLGFVARADVVRAIGGYEVDFPGMYDDQVFFSKLALAGPVFVTHRCTYRYRQHRGSMVSGSFADGSRAVHRLRFLNWLGAFLAEREVRSLRVHAAHRLELWKSRHPGIMEGWGRLRRLQRRARNRLGSPRSVQAAS